MRHGPFRDLFQLVWCLVVHELWLLRDLLQRKIVCHVVHKPGEVVQEVHRFFPFPCHTKSRLFSKTRLNFCVIFALTSSATYDCPPTRSFHHVQIQIQLVQQLFHLPSIPSQLSRPPDAHDDLQFKYIPDSFAYLSIVISMLVRATMP